MDKPKPISSGEAMRWNADVERRRNEYHQRRCAEDPIYKRVYVRHLEMMQRMQKMQSDAMTHLQNAMNEEVDTKCRQATDQTAVSDQTLLVKTHDEIMKESAALLDRMEQYRKSGAVTFGECALSAFILATLFDPDAKQRLKDIEEEKPYAEEIRKVNHEFDTELICLSGFEW